NQAVDARRAQSQVLPARRVHGGRQGPGRSRHRTVDEPEKRERHRRCDSDGGKVRQAEAADGQESSPYLLNRDPQNLERRLVLSWDEEVMMRTKFIAASLGVVAALVIYSRSTEVVAQTGAVALYEGARVIVGDGTPAIENAAILVQGGRVLAVG